MNPRHLLDAKACPALGEHFYFVNIPRALALHPSRRHFLQEYSFFLHLVVSKNSPFLFHDRFNSHVPLHSTTSMHFMGKGREKERKKEQERARERRRRKTRYQVK